MCQGSTCAWQQFACAENRCPVTQLLRCADCQSTSAKFPVQTARSERPLFKFSQRSRAKHTAAVKKALGRAAARVLTTNSGVARPTGSRMRPTGSAHASSREDRESACKGRDCLPKGGAGLDHFHWRSRRFLVLITGRGWPRFQKRKHQSGTRINSDPQTQIPPSLRWKIVLPIFRESRTFIIIDFCSSSNGMFCDFTRISMISMKGILPAWKSRLGASNRRRGGIGNGITGVWTFRQLAAFRCLGKSKKLRGRYVGPFRT